MIPSEAHTQPPLSYMMYFPVSALYAPSAFDFQAAGEPEAAKLVPSLLSLDTTVFHESPVCAALNVQSGYFVCKALK